MEPIDDLVLLLIDYLITPYWDLRYSFINVSHLSVYTNEQIKVLVPRKWELYKLLIEIEKKNLDSLQNYYTFLHFFDTYTEVCSTCKRDFLYHFVFVCEECSKHYYCEFCNPPCLGNQFTGVCCQF